MCIEYKFPSPGGGHNFLLSLTSTAMVDSVVFPVWVLPPTIWLMIDITRFISSGWKYLTNIRWFCALIVGPCDMVVARAAMVIASSKA